MLRHALVTAVGLTVLTGTALAQTAPATPPASPATPSGTGTQGITSAQTSTATVRFVTVKPADVLSSRLVGTDVYNKQNENLGEIADIVVENGKTVTGLVVGVGGFLGMGERYVLVDPSSVTLTRQNDESWRAVLDTNKDALRNAPTFDYKKRS